ncbi:MAG: hypothetical protein HY580_08055 [Nitrospinae bacterium]|nr:hypothetical protein [Nitrospinota bacterium]
MSTLGFPGSAGAEGGGGACSPGGGTDAAGGREGFAASPGGAGAGGADGAGAVFPTTVTVSEHDPDREPSWNVQKKVNWAVPPATPAMVKAPCLAEEMERGLTAAMEELPPPASKFPTVTPSPDKT